MIAKVSPRGANSLNLHYQTTRELPAQRDITMEGASENGASSAFCPRGFPLSIESLPVPSVIHAASKPQPNPRIKARAFDPRKSVASRPIPEAALPGWPRMRLICADQAKECANNPVQKIFSKK